MGQRILLVESDRTFLKEHQAPLETAFDLEVTGSPEGVIPCLESGDFGAVCISVEVADGKGYALCSAIRKHPNLDQVKIALLSAKATEEEYRRHQGLKGRADLYLHKPIATSALVAALTPLVPGRTQGAGSPMSELIDTDLGDDWLAGLRSALEAPDAAAATPPGAHQDLPAQGTPVPPDGRARLLEEELAALREELRARQQHLEAAEAELQQTHHQLNSVTQNLDKLERDNRESEALKARLAEAESTLRSLEESRGREGDGAETLKAQLMEALSERAELIEQVDALQHQVSEKAHRTIEVLKERDRLLHDNLELEPFRAKAQELASTVAHREEALATVRLELESALAAQRQFEAALEEMSGQRASLEGTLQATQRELDAAREALSQHNTTVEKMAEQYAVLEGLHQVTLSELMECQEKVHAAQLELAGLDATLHGQGRELAQQGEKLSRLEAELEASTVRVVDQDQQLQAKEGLLRQLQDEFATQAAEVVALQKNLDETRSQHDGERLELLEGIDQRDAELESLKQELAGKREACTVLEQERQVALGQLSAQQDRLHQLDALLLDIQDKLRLGSALVQG